MLCVRWQEIVKIFEAALDKPQSERDQLISDVCCGDKELEAAVRQLLAADASAGSFLEKPALSDDPSLCRGPSGYDVLPCGTVISERFEILRLLGQGGMGQVYAVLDRDLKEPVALKTIRPDISSDPDILHRFRREVQLTRRITHPNVCRIFDMERHISTTDLGEPKELIFLTMELLEGETLAELLRREGRLSEEKALPLILQMVEALDAAHQVGVVHRDFKPSNVMLVPSTHGFRVVITDFGLAHIVTPGADNSTAKLASSLSGAHSLVGTLAYMSPEQLERGEATKASDIYALGLVMFEMVTGERPFANSIPFAEAVIRIKRNPPSARSVVPELSANCDEAIRKCLEAEPEKRFDRVLAVSQALTGAALSEGRFSSSRDWLIRLGGYRGRSLAWSKKLVIVAISLVAMSLFGISLRHYLVRTDSKVSRGSTMLLTEVQNSTGDAKFGGITELVREQLSQSPHFNLVDVQRIGSVLRRMNKTETSILDPAVARDVALRTGAARVIFGGISRVGDNYVLDIAIEQPDNNPRRYRGHWENHWTWQMRSGSSEKEMPGSFLSAIRDAGDWIRSEAGEPGNDIASVGISPEDVTTGNWNALSEFMQAERFKAAGKTDSAIVALKNAIAEDPGFALAYTRLGDLLISVNRYDEGYRAYEVALAEEKQGRLTRREKDRLKGIYAHDREDFLTAEAAFRDYTVYYPNDYIGWFYRSYPLMMMGRTQEAVASLKRAATIDPQKMFAPANIARFELILENYQDAVKWTQHLRDSGHVNDADLVDGESDFLQGRYAEAQAKFEKLRASDDPLYRSYGCSLLARLFAEMGQYKNAINALEEGIDIDLESGDSASRADKYLDRAYLNFKRRMYDDCFLDVKRALALDRSLPRSLFAGTLLARAAFASSETSKDKLLVELRGIERLLPGENAQPLSVTVRARLRGERFLVQGKWEAALQEFKKADELEAVAKDREYLARGSLTAARHLSGNSQPLKERAFSTYQMLALRPGQIWQWALDYPPGYFSDISLAYLNIASQRAELTERDKTLLNEYLTRRSIADDGLADIEEAKRIASHSVSVVPTNQKGESK